jgi:hypothetical protein
MFMQRTFSSKDSIGLPEVCISMIKSQNVLSLSLQQLQFQNVNTLSKIMKSKPHSYNKEKNRTVKIQNNNCDNDLEQA